MDEVFAGMDPYFLIRNHRREDDQTKKTMKSFWTHLFAHYWLENTYVKLESVFGKIEKLEKFTRVSKGYV